MVEEYLQDLHSGKKVILVPHSQGNFYANNAYQFIKNNYPQYANSIGIVATGTPASRVQDGGRHTTNSKDLIVNLVRLGFSVLPANFTYDQPKNKKNHDFVKTYLAGAGPKIRGDIFHAINTRLQVPAKHNDCKTPDEVPVDIDTRSATNITTSSARTNSYVASGKNIYVWTEFREGSYPSSCSNTAGGKPGSGSFQTGNTPYLNKRRLKSGTTYYYRKCAKGTNNRVSDGGVVSFTTNSVTTTVQTLGVTDISATSAEMQGKIVSGDGINYWWKCGTTSNISCSSSVNTGNGDAGEIKTLRWNGLISGTKYYYRFCGRGKDRTHSGAIKSFTTITVLPCNSSFSGSSEGIGVDIYTDASSSFNKKTIITFKAYDIPDALEIRKGNGSLIASTNGLISGSRTWVKYGSDMNGTVHVRVTGNNDPQTRWDISISCPVLN